tara:strand:+ start:1899 stop:3179 length:1281 start_codon:yes stop_codon:yes gene_type:complete
MPVNPSNSRLRKAKNLNNYGAPYGGFGFGLPTSIGNRFRMFTLYQKKCHSYENPLENYKWSLINQFNNNINSNFGEYIQSSHNGSVIVVVAPNFEKNINANDLKVGKIFVYEFDFATNVYNLTHSIEGNYNHRYTNPSNKRIGVTADGSTFIVTSSEIDNNAATLPARCRIFKKVNNNWSQHAEITLPKTDSLTCCINKDGNRIAISNANNSNANDGLVHIYKPGNANATLWMQDGNTITHGATDTGFGYSLSFNKEGSIIVIGTKSNNSCVKIFNNNNNNWTMNTIINSNDFEFGKSVDIDGDGLYVAITNHHNSKFHIYKYDNNAKVYIPYQIFNAGVGKLGETNVSISTDGKRLIISDKNTGNGYFSIYKLNKPHNNLWVKEITIQGDTVGQKLGTFALINGNGESIIVSDNNEKIYKYKFGL